MRTLLNSMVHWFDETKPSRAAGILPAGPTCPAFYCLTLLLILLILSLPSTVQAADTPRFGTVDIYLDPHGLPLAAYQLELNTSDAQVKISGIEGGGHTTFQNPPYYDPKAMQGNQVILAAFSKAAADQLPKGKVRVATVHYMTTGSGKPDFTLKLITSGTSNARKIKAEASIQERGNP